MGDNFFMEGKRVFAHHGTALPLATTKLTPPMHLLVIDWQEPSWQSNCVTLHLRRRNWGPITAEIT